MGNLSVTVDGLASAVMDALTDYVDGVSIDVKECVKEVSEQCKQEISAAAPRDSGRYAKSWTTKKTKENANQLEMTVHSKIPGLPHLLEHGHATRNGGRTKAYPHIAPAEENACVMLEDKIKKAVRK